ncbi:recombinase RecT [Micromonospora sp. RV43]|uniref:recombinase RecT n=1 Tax=Micromonospora sp. RV43 TaxID=1661387 RepID=UPI00064BB649|nr:recombinase RecT [Micromonospora sp. RV43]
MSTTARTRAQKLAAQIPDVPAGDTATAGNAVATKKPDYARDLLASMEEEFEAALPRVLPIDVFMRVALTGFRKTPELLECTRSSLFGALLETARLGLEPCTEYAYLIPFGRECTLVVGYQGYVQLMYRTGQVDRVEAEMVYEGDEWEYSLGDGGKFFHRPNIAAPVEERGRPIFAYSYAALRGGGRTKVAWCNRAQAERIKAEFARSAKSPWRDPNRFDAMWLKTPVRQLQKYAPKSAELRRALAVDGATYDASGLAMFEDGRIIDPDTLPGEIVDGPVDEPQPTTDGGAEDGPASVRVPNDEAGTGDAAQ